MPRAEPLLSDSLGDVRGLVFFSVAVVVVVVGFFVLFFVFSIQSMFTTSERNSNSLTEVRVGPLGSAASALWSFYFFPNSSVGLKF